MVGFSLSCADAIGTASKKNRSESAINHASEVSSALCCGLAITMRLFIRRFQRRLLLGGHFLCAFE